MIAFEDFSCRWSPLGLFLTKRGPTFETGVSIFGTCNRRRMLLGGDIPQGITEMHRSGPRAMSDPED